jgi:hypothetical protein
VAAIAKPDLPATLNGDFFVGLERFGEDIHHSDLVSESNNYVETRRMECYTISFILEYFTNFQCFSIVIPNSDCFVNAASRNQILLHTNIQSMDLSRVIRINKVFISGIVSGSLQVHIHLHDLVVFSGEEKNVFCAR